jgi:4-hydroxybenzoate polyprenyltransferase
VSLPRTIGTYASLVKLSHTVFALPFALAAVVLASRYARVTVGKVALIVVCIAAARTAAMAFNRLVDRDIDGKNPRTADRELPRGAVGVGAVRVLVFGACAVFITGAALLGPLPLLLSPVALGLALGYSYAKRFTALCHVILGLAVAFAPGGAWIALGAPLTAAPFLLVLAVACWVAGFDVLYSLQDRDFDQGHELHSIPARLGIGGALWVSALLHIATVACLLGAGFALGRGVAYLAGVGIVTALLIYEHALVRPTDLSRIDKAFFDLNGYVSLVFFACVVLDQLLA